MEPQRQFPALNRVNFLDNITYVSPPKNDHIGITVNVLKYKKKHCINLTIICVNVDIFNNVRFMTYDFYDSRLFSYILF